MSEVITHTPAAEAPGLKRDSLRVLLMSEDCLLPVSGLGPKSALVAIARLFDDRTGTCTGSNVTIGLLMGGISKEQASRYITELCKIRVAGRALVSKRHNQGRSNTYIIHEDVLASLDNCKPKRAESVDNSVDTPTLATTAPRHVGFAPLSYTLPTPVIASLYPCHFTGIPLSYKPTTPVIDDNRTVLGTVLSTGGGTEARGTDEVDHPPAVPPLLDLEDLNTSEPEPKPEAAPAPAPIADLVTTPPAAPAAERAVAIAPETLAAVNAQRATHGKTALRRADMVELGRQATLAGMAPQAAAEWILAKPTRSFFKAEWLLAAKPAAQAVPAPIDEAARAQARARAEQVQAELLRASIAAMRRDDGIVLPPSAAPSARPAPQRTVTVRSAAPVSVGGGSPASVKRSAEQWLDDYAAGRPFKVHQFEHALALTGRSRDELRAKRATAKAALAATGGAA